MKFTSHRNRRKLVRTQDSETISPDIRLQEFYDLIDRLNEGKSEWDQQLGFAVLLSILDCRFHKMKTLTTFMQGKVAQWLSRYRNLQTHHYVKVQNYYRSNDDLGGRKVLDATTKNFIVEYYAGLRELQIEIQADERAEGLNVFQTSVAAAQKHAEEPMIVIEAGEPIPSSPKIMVPSKAEVIVGPTIRFDPKTREVHRESLPRTHWLDQKCGRAFIAQARMANQPLLVHLWH